MAEKKYPFPTSKNISKNAKTGYVKTQDFENENVPTAATGLKGFGHSGQWRGLSGHWPECRWPECHWPECPGPVFFISTFR